MGFKVSILYKAPNGTRSSVFNVPGEKQARAWLYKNLENIIEVEVHNATTGKLIGRVRGDQAPF